MACISNFKDNASLPLEGLIMVWYEIIIGAVSATLTYIFIQYSKHKSEQRAIQESVAEQIVANAKDVGTERESMDWLNFIIKQWYLVVDERLQEKIKEIVEPILEDLDLPNPVTGIELGTVSFGQNPPKISYVQAAKVLWEDDECMQGLRLILGPKIDCPEFVVELKIKALGEVTATMTQFKFDGELRVSILKNTDMPFPCIQQVFFTFEERPEIEFKIGYGLANLGMIPGLEDWVMNTVEDVVTDTLVNPGRFYIDLSDGNVKPFLIKGVRKLKRTVLHLKIEVANQKKDRDSDKKKKIVFSLNTGGKDLKSKVDMREHRKTHHIFYPLAVLQGEVKLKIKIDKTMGKDDTLVDISIPVHDLIDDTTTIKDTIHAERQNLIIQQDDGDVGLTDGQNQIHTTREVHRKAIPHLNMLCSVKATAYTLPYISIRQSMKEVTDFESFYKINKLDGNDVRACPSGLVYLHIHRATSLPAKDTTGSDPYVIAFVDKKELFRTKVGVMYHFASELSNKVVHLTRKEKRNRKVVYNKCDPIFNHFEDIFVQNVLQSKVTLEVWDRDEMSKDDFIGKLDLDLRDVVPKTVNNAFQLSDEKKVAGSIFLSVIFRPIRLPTPDENSTVVLENNFGAITTLG